MMTMAMLLKKLKGSIIVGCAMLFVPIAVSKQRFSADFLQHIDEDAVCKQEQPSTGNQGALPVADNEQRSMYQCCCRAIDGAALVYAGCQLYVVYRAAAQLPGASFIPVPVHACGQGLYIISRYTPILFKAVFYRTLVRCVLAAAAGNWGTVVWPVRCAVGALTGI